MQLVHVLIGRDGWVLWRPPGDDDHPGVRVHVTENADGRLVIDRLEAVEGSALTAGLLRRLNLGTFEIMINSAAIRETITQAADAPNVSSVRQTSFGKRLPAIPIGPPGTLPNVEAKGRRPDEFYLALAAEIASLASGGSRRPAADIAEANGVPITTVHRWMKEARRRGLLKPARPKRRASS